MVEPPKTHEEWAAMSDEQVQETVQAWGGHAGVGAQAEMMRRLIVALREFRDASARASRRLEYLTAAIAVLTVLLVLIETGVI